METEIWKDVQGYEGLYQVSNFGRVKTIKTNIIRKFGDNGHGYMFLPLHKNNKSKNHYVHRLVATSFIDNLYRKTTVNHINGIKADNSVSNLEWATQSENSQHGFDNGLIKQKSGYENPSSKAVLKYSLGGEFICEYENISIASINNKILSNCISMNCRQKTKRAGDFQWKFKSDEETIIHPIPLKKGNGEIKVLQYSKKGEFISKFNSQTEAEAVTGVKRGGISDCCTGKIKTSGGFIWKFKQEI